MNFHLFWLCFVPIFIATDAIGALPVFIALTKGIQRKRIIKLILVSLLTAAIVGLLFVYIGEQLLRLMGITVADFMVAGGILLFVISLGDMVTIEKPTRRVNAEELGPVPIGVPLIVGPGVLTTIMLLAKEHGFILTTIALLMNIALAGLIFSTSAFIVKMVGKNGTKIISKIASLFLTAISVMIIRKGIFLMLQQN
jgi:multiple antibiotic resistance protein